MTRPTLHDREALQRFRKERCVDGDRLRRVLYGVFQLHELIDVALARLDVNDANALAAEFDLEPLAVVQVFESAVDWSSKMVLRTTSGDLMETVLLRASTGRTSVCVSTQIGCAAGCPFCATARMGLRRDLSAAEIVEQVLVAARMARRENRRLRNIVFMGMGEPLDNEAALHSAIERLLDRTVCGFPGRRLTVSTIGLPAAMVRLIDRFPQVRLALSLHSARPELRIKLVPRSRTHSWNELRDALRYVAHRHEEAHPNVPVMIEHLMLAGINDNRADVEALIEYVRGIRVHVNLIPFNPIPTSARWAPSERTQRDQFAKHLRRAGIFTTIRYSMGPDIQAACGQLALQESLTAAF